MDKGIERGIPRLAVFLIGFAFFVTGFEFALLCIVVPRYIHDISRAVMTVSLIFSLSSIMVFAGQNLFGFLYDRTGGFWYYIALSSAAFALPLALLPHLPPDWRLVAVLSATSFFQTALFPAAESYLTIRYPRTKGRILGRLFAFESYGWGCGALTAAALSVLIDSPAELYAPLFYTGAALAASALAAALIFGMIIRGTPAPKSRTTDGKTYMKELLSDIKLVYNDGRIRRVCLVFFLLDGAMAAFFHLFSIYFTTHLGGQWFLTCLCMGAAGLIGALTFPWFGAWSDRHGRRPLVFYAIAGNFVMFTGFLLTKNTFLLAILYTLPVYSAIRVAARGYLADLTREETRGGGLGLIGGIQALAAGITPLLAGFLAARFGLGIQPWTALGLLGLTTLSAFLLLDEYGTIGSEPS